ncbi:MAG: SRPBCC family protein [Thermoproteota archaeon]
MTKNSSTDKQGDREITTTRIFDAPRELVFKMWTDPKYIVQWWGPNGFTITIYEMDVRPGGVWQFVMHGPDGTDYKNKFIYDEIVMPERIAYSHVSGPQFRAIVTFDDQDSKTKVTVWMTFESAEERDNVVKKYGAIEGLNQTLGRLEQQLAKMLKVG